MPKPKRKDTQRATRPVDRLIDAIDRLEQRLQTVQIAIDELAAKVGSIADVSREATWHACDNPLDKNNLIR